MVEEELQQFEKVGAAGLGGLLLACGLHCLQMHRERWQLKTNASAHLGLRLPACCCAGPHDGAAAACC